MSGHRSLEGLRVVGRSRLLSTTLLALALTMLGLGAINVLFLPLLVNVLGVSPTWIGAVDLAQSASMILSAGLVAMLAARLHPTTIVTVALLAVGVLIGLVGATTHMLQVLVLLFGIGWFVTPVQAAVVTIFQTGVPDAARGRAMATLQAAMSGASVASMMLAGVFGDLVGVRMVFFIGGAVVVIGGIAAGLLYRGVRTEAPGREPVVPAATRPASRRRAEAMTIGSPGT